MVKKEKTSAEKTAKKPARKASAKGSQKAVQKATQRVVHEAPRGDGYISTAVLRNVRVSPQKARLVIDLIRGKRVGYALDQLQFCDKKTAPLLRKLILSAVSSAQLNSSVDVDELIVKRAWVNAGRTIKRVMPRAQGRATPIKKRHSTITVVLDEKVANA